jgi:hypothetical protein
LSFNTLQTFGSEVSTSVSSLSSVSATAIEDGGKEEKALQALVGSDVINVQEDRRTPAELSFTINPVVSMSHDRTTLYIEDAKTKIGYHLQHSNEVTSVNKLLNKWRSFYST